MNQKKKNSLSFLIRLALSGALLGWLFSRIDVTGMIQTVRTARPGFIIAAGLLFFLVNLVILYRWYVIVGALKLQLPVSSGIRWYLIGTFGNLFLPTAIGGDVIRAIGLSRETDEKPKVFASVLLDRLSGFAGIVIVAVAALLAGYRIIKDVSVIGAIAVMAALSLGVTGFLFNHRLYSLACFFFNRLPRLKKSIMQMHYDVVLMKRERGRGLWAIAISCGSQIILALTYWLLVRGLHQEVAFHYFLIFTPIVCVVTALPSIGGLGVREVGWVYLLAKVGVPEGVAAGVSLIFYAYMIAIGIIGGIVYISTLSSRPEVAADIAGKTSADLA